MRGDDRSRRLPAGALVTERSTRSASVRCVRCGAPSRAIVVNIPIDCPEPVTIECGWIRQDMCPVARVLRTTHPPHQTHEATVTTKGK